MTLNPLSKYLPLQALEPVLSLLDHHAVQLKIVNERKTRHGDYRHHGNGLHVITINSCLNKYRFLITLIHEIAHLVAFQKYGGMIKPHGREWKFTFQHLMLPLLRPEIFPSELLPLLARHFKNPRASSDTDSALSIALKRYDIEDAKTFIFELSTGALFMFQGRLFKKGKKLRKRYQCLEMETQRLFVFQPNAQVEIVKE
jgi:hypothetical protein